ncbi:unnamed protein product [Durusdinium trenchii]|uniref:Uncharacterized protein n=1 Tax=Durusdinium trenchii TaxID=1381693 RepID=A0ABP0MZG3_9DINO
MRPWKRRPQCLACVAVLCALAANAWCFLHHMLGPGPESDRGEAVQARRALLASLVAGFPAPAVAFRNSKPKAIKAGEAMPDLDPDYPPAPSDDPWIRGLQAKSWEREPITRTRFYLMDEMTKIQPNPFGEKKDMIRWNEDPVKWDVVSAQDRRTAENLGPTLGYPDLTSDAMGWQSYIYTAAEDRDWAAKNLNITQTIELDKPFQEQLKLIRSRKFGVD